MKLVLNIVKEAIICGRPIVQSISNRQCICGMSTGSSSCEVYSQRAGHHSNQRITSLDLRVDQSVP